MWANRPASQSFLIDPVRAGTFTAAQSRIQASIPVLPNSRLEAAPRGGPGYGSRMAGAVLLARSMSSGNSVLGPILNWIEFSSSKELLCDDQPMNMIRKFLVDESAATAIEYGIAAGIAVAIIAGVNGLGTKISSNFVKINTSLE
jgi:pilus assembly protein Flp/PilA